MCGFVLYEAKPGPEPWKELHYKVLQGLRQKAASIPPILHQGQILTHLHAASQNSTPTGCGVVCDQVQKDLKKTPKHSQANKQSIIQKQVTTDRA